MYGQILSRAATLITGSLNTDNPLAHTDYTVDHMQQKNDKLPARMSYPNMYLKSLQYILCLINILSQGILLAPGHQSIGLGFLLVNKWLLLATLEKKRLFFTPKIILNQWFINFDCLLPGAILVYTSFFSRQLAMVYCVDCWKLFDRPRSMCASCDFQTAATLKARDWHRLDNKFLPVMYPK